MNRRGFLRSLGLVATAAVAPTKTYAFFGGILRPRKELDLTSEALTPLTLEKYVTYWAMQNGGWTTRKEEAGTFNFPCGDGHIIPGQITYLAPPSRVEMFQFRDLYQT